FSPGISRARWRKRSFGRRETRRPPIQRPLPVCEAIRPAQALPKAVHFVLYPARPQRAVLPRREKRQAVAWWGRELGSGPPPHRSPTPARRPPFLNLTQ